MATKKTRSKRSVPKEAAANPLVDDAPQELSGDGLASATELARKQFSIELHIAKIEAKLKEKKEELRKVAEDEIPDLFNELGIKKLTLRDGHEMVIEDILGVTATPEAIEWLIDNGYGDIVKNIVTTHFDKGQEDEAEELLEKLIEDGYEPENTVSVHNSTLRAWAKKFIAEGGDLPKETFKLHQAQKAKLKAPKK